MVRLDPVAVAGDQAAQPGGVQAPIVRAEFGRTGAQLVDRLDGEAGDHARDQQLCVDQGGFGQVGQQGTVPFDPGAALDQRVGDPVHARPYRGRGRDERVVVEDQDPEVLEPLTTRGRQRQPMRHTERQRIRPGHDVEQQRQVAGAARHRTDDGEIVLDRQGRRGRRHHAAGRRQPERRLVRVDAAEVRRCAQRTRDVGADGQRPEPARQRRRRPAGGAARRAPQVPGVVGGAVDLVVALHVVQPQGHIGLAEHHRARRPEPRHLHRVLGRHVVAVLRHAPGRRQTGDVVGLLDRHRNAEQRPLLASGPRPVGVARGGPGPLEVRHADRVDRLVVPLDAGDRLVGQFRRAHVTGTQGGRELLGRLLAPLHGSDRNGPREGPRNTFSDKGLGVTAWRSGRVPPARGAPWRSPATARRRRVPGGTGCNRP